MNSDSLEARVYAHVRKHDGFYLFGKPELTEQTDLDFDLQLDEDEALALMEDFLRHLAWRGEISPLRLTIRPIHR